MQNSIDTNPRTVLGIENTYVDGHQLNSHAHRRGQLLYGASGAVMVTTAQKTWLVPPKRGIWIPAEVFHEVRMLGEVTTYSLYIKSGHAEMPDECQVVGIPPFMQALMAEAASLPHSYDMDGREGALMNLIKYEIMQLPVLPLSIAFPRHKALFELCRNFVARPCIHETIDDWSNALGLSRRTFTRLFRNETGLAFSSWRQQACIMCALPRLIAGEGITVVAIDLGYDNPAAFTSMFKRMLGSSPRNYLKGTKAG